MKKGLIATLLVVLGFFFYTSYRAHAYEGSWNIFGGKIISDKALEVGELEDFGYICDVPGYSIEVLPVGSPAGAPTSYFIPYTAKSLTRTTPYSGKFIMGRYAGLTEIVCQHPESEDIQTVSLNTVDLYGTTR